MREAERKLENEQDYPPSTSTMKMIEIARDSSIFQNSSSLPYFLDDGFIFFFSKVSSQTRQALDEACSHSC